MNISKLSQKEIKRIAALLIKKIAKPEKGVGDVLFDALIKIVPQVTSEAVIVDNIKAPTKILLFPRKDKYYKGWHVIGSFTKFGENFKTALQKTVLKETGCKIKKYKDTGYKYNIIDLRGHTISLVYLVEINSGINLKKGRWFNCKKLPDNLLGFHKKVLKKVLNC